MQKLLSWVAPESGRGKAQISGKGHVRRALGVALVSAAVVCAALPAAAAATDLPKGFEAREMVGGLTSATGVAFAPDGRAFIVEKDGRLKVAQPGAKTASLLLDISDHVNSYGDRGLLGVAVDKDFATNGYVYLLYTYELNKLIPDDSGAMVSRLTRITIGSNGAVANPANPETTLIGSYSAGPCPTASNTLDCIPSEGSSHSIGSVRVDPTDGTLYVGSGDASDFNSVDPMALRTYDESSYAGKILHVDRNGNGLPGHSFCPADQTLTHVCTKLYAKGFRNPFRFELRPTGGLTVGDVGWNTWEEVDLINAAGRNYGWPCYEAHTRTPGYDQNPVCKAQYAKEGTDDAVVLPDWKYDRSTGGSAVVGGPTYLGDQYPAGYENSIFYGDYTGHFIERMVLNSSGTVDHVESFATDWIGTALELAPSGNLVAVNFGTGSGPDGFIEEYVYSPGNTTPVAQASATPTSGEAPLNVQFKGDASKDADGDTLSYAWDFGDGTPGSTVANPKHTYTQPGTFTATLTVDDGRGRSASKSIKITPGGDPPTVSIDAPVTGDTYRDGDVVALRGSATDPQDGTLSGASLQWTVTLHHLQHTHPLSAASGAISKFTAQRDHDADSHYEITLVATDKKGLTASKTVEIYPQTVTMQINSAPAGAPVTYGGRAFLAPTTQTTAIGYDTTVSAAERYSVGSRRFQFESWSDGGALVHNLRVPDAAATLKATYVEDFAAAGTATASSIEGPDFAAANALDDSSLTRWSSQPGDGAWWQVDLGAAKSITSVEVDWEDAYASKYRILTSLDGTDFTEAAQGAASGAGTAATALAPRSARYVRIEALERANDNWGISAFDVRVLGPVDEPVTPPDDTPPDDTPPGGGTPRQTTPPILPPVDTAPPGRITAPKATDTTRPTVKRVTVVKRAHGRRVLTLHLSERGTVSARVRRRVKGHWKSVARIKTRKAQPAGTVRISLPRSLKAGRYSVVVSAIDAAGNATRRPVTIRFGV